MPETLSPEQALIFTMIATSAVDARMADVELGLIGSITRELEVFKAFEADRLLDEAKACQKVVSGDNGLASVLDMIEEATPDHLRETAYLLAAEVAAADQHVRMEERRFLQLLGQRLRLDALTVAALQRAARVRHQAL